LRTVEADRGLRIARGESVTFIHIVTTRRKLRELQRVFLKSAPRGCAPAFLLHTLETFSHRLHELLCVRKRLIGRPLQSVILGEAIRDLRGTLRYFRRRGIPAALPPGTLQKLLRALMNLKERGVYPSLLRIEAESAGPDEHAKLSDLADIYEAYESRLGTMFTDSPGMMKEVNFH